MPYLVPPMDAEPPHDYVEFVARHLGALKDEAARLTGGECHADEVYPEALADVAGHWRRLRWHRRLRRRDAPDDFLLRRLRTRARQWREEQIYPVEIDGLPAPVPAGAVPGDTVARRLAPLLPPTVRTQLRPLAEAAIAWEHAYRRARLRRIARTVAGVVLLMGAIAQAVPALPGS